MAIIKIDDLDTADYEKFAVSKSFLKDLSTKDSQSLFGGNGDDFYQLLKFGLAGFAIHSITSVTNWFMESSHR